MGKILCFYFTLKDRRAKVRSGRTLPGRITTGPSDLMLAHATRYN
jgi:hypothetical protein